MEAAEHILYEHVSGYELFELLRREGIADESYNDYLALAQSVRHVSSLPFGSPETVAAAVEATGLPEGLQGLLALNGVSVLHADKSLRALLAPIGIEYRSSPAVMRGLRTYATRLLGRPLDTQLLRAAAHTIARSAIRYDMGREDNVAVAVAHECAELEGAVAALSARRAALLAWAMPHATRLFGSNLDEALTAMLAGAEVPAAGSSTLLVDEARALVAEVSDVDRSCLVEINASISEKKHLLQELEGYLAEKMRLIAPNLRRLLGDRLAVTLIHRAGGLNALALLPASTVQLLGAEKSLFRALKMRTPTPKHGILFSAGAGQGRICRFVATKASLAARIDAFSVDRSDAYGVELKRLVDRRISSNCAVEPTQDLLKRVHASLTNRQRDSRIDDSNGKHRPQDTKCDEHPDSTAQGSENTKTNRNNTFAAKEKPRTDGKKGKGLFDLTESAKRKIKPKENKKYKKNPL